MAISEKEMEQAILATTLTLELKVADVNVILSLIGKYPFEEVNNLVRNIHEQGQPQIAARVQELQAESEIEDVEVVEKLVKVKKSDKPIKV